MKSFFLPALVSTIIFVAEVSASAVTDSENRLRDFYEVYRAALFATNSGDEVKAVEAVKAMNAQWATFIGDYTDSPPPQYTEDTQWSITLSSLSGYINKSASAIGDGKLSEAHELLEGIRDQIVALHERNSIETFSDRMAAYHAEMEKVLNMDIDTIDATNARLLSENAAVLSYLVKELLRLPPPEGRDNPEFKELTLAVEASVNVFLEASRMNDPAAVKASITKLKGPYANLFLKFG